MKHDYAAAIAEVTKWNDRVGELKEAAFEIADSFLLGKCKKNIETLQAITHALKLAQKLDEEPSDGLLKAAQDAWLNDPTKRSSTLWKAMVEQMKKEVE